MRGLVILLLVALALACSVMPLSAYAARQAFASPDKEWAEPAVYFAARVRMRFTRFLPAAAILEQAIKTWPKSDRVDEAAYWIGFCYERSQVNERAIYWYKAFLERFPNHQWAAQARRRLDTLEAQNL